MGMIRAKIWRTLTALAVVSLPGRSWAQFPRPVGFIAVGGESARTFAVERAGAKPIGLTPEQFGSFRALWWHCEMERLPAEMTSAETAAAIRDYVRNGGGLLLSGSALRYVAVLGVEIAVPRYLAAGRDVIAAGFQPLPPCRSHPLFAGFSEMATMVTSGGHPGTSDFFGSGGPREGAALVRASPDQGEWPIVEYALGKGRILAIGWRLADYGRQDNRYRRNLERLTRNALAYLGNRRWFDLAAVGKWRERPIRIGLVPNSHGTICGWLIPWSAERRKVIDVLKQHLACLRQEPAYRFALSEVPNLVSAMELLSPEEWQQLKEQIRRGRVELVNSFYLEPDVNLADGEALCQMAIQGVRWNREVMGKTPSTCWMIDAVGMHPQMPQIVSKTGIGSIVFTRGNRTDSPMFHWESPDGSRVLALHWPYYGWFGEPGQPGALFDPKATLAGGAKALNETLQSVAGSPVDSALVPIGQGDYSPPPAHPALLANAIANWNAAHTKQQMEITLPRKFLSEISVQRDGAAAMPVYAGELDYSWMAFNVNMPFVKQRFRKLEHLLTTAEKAATLASLYGMAYPAQELHKAWIDLLLNMDRNTIWGAAIEEVFIGEKEWNATDRFDAVKQIAGRVLEQSLRYIGQRCRRRGTGPEILVFNPLSWKRARTQEIETDAAGGLGLLDDRGRPIASQVVSRSGGRARMLVKVNAPALGYTLVHRSQKVTAELRSETGQTTISTRYYTLFLNSKTGAIRSLRDRNGRELLAGESNVVIEQSGADEHFPQPRERRKTLASSGDSLPRAITVQRGLLATIVRVRSVIGGVSALTREIRLYDDSPRIDFKTTIDWRGKDRIVSVHFQVPRSGPAIHGVPYGQVGRQDGLYPTLGWCDLPTPYGGLALLDRGIPNREIAGSDAAMLLLNSVQKYIGNPCPALAANGMQEFEYALLPHKGDTVAAAIPQAYWDYIEPLVAASVTPRGNLPRMRSFLATGPEAVVTALRREADSQVVRVVNLEPKLSRGQRTAAAVIRRDGNVLAIGYPHNGITKTNLLGEPMDRKQITGSHFDLDLRPQEIRTLSIRAGTGSATTRPITRWSDLTTKVAIREPNQAPYSMRERLAIRAVTPSARTVLRYGRFELTLDLTASYENPFDPDEIDVNATFVSPAGKSVTVNGFLDRPYSRRLAGRQEILTPAGAPVWNLRFTPDLAGKWRYRVRVKDRSGSATMKEAAFDVKSSNDPGFIRRSRRNPAVFAYADERPVFLVGENMGWGGWNGVRGTYDYDEWLANLGKAGGNWVRVWMSSWNCALEWSPDPNLASGEYRGVGSYNLASAWKLDTILDSAERAGVSVMLCLGTYGEFTDGGFFNEGQWKANPYNAVNGGPCAKPLDFWTNEKARKLYQRRLRYITARYGCRTSIQSWEFWNEAQAPVAWVAEMAQFVKGPRAFQGKPADPYGHLLTTSYGNDAVWKLPEIDITQTHHYGMGNVPDHAPVVHDDAVRHRAYEKPHLMAEFGIDWRKGDEQYDPEGRGINLHNGLWAAMMSGDAGGAMIWWWDGYIHPKKLYRQFIPVRKFADRIPWTTGRLEPLMVELVRPPSNDPSRPPTATSTQLTLYGQTDGKMAILWAHNTGYNWKNQFEKKPVRTIEGATAMVRGLAPGAYTVEWWDTWTGQALRRDEIRSIDQGILLRLPDVATDVAARIFK